MEYGILANMKIPRFYQEVGRYLQPGKVLVIYGPRQVGKTTLLKDFLAGCRLRYKLDSGDHIRVQDVLSSQDFTRLKEYAAGYELIALDEAQRVPRVGQGLKILVDELPTLRVIATGSSSFELSGQVGEPLTGRKKTLTLYPIAQLELAALQNPHELKEHLPDWMVFGTYPEVLNAASRREKQDVLEELVHAYLLKDVLELERVKGSKVLLDLLRLIAFQVGSEVSLSELASQVGLDTKTVGRYLDLLEQSFVLYNLRGLSRNLRSEITRTSKYYFYDNGVRNALIANFNELALRNDVGELWENFVMAERLKKTSYQAQSANRYFWRTWNQQEVDLVEEREGRLFGYEVKWREPRKPSPPPLWLGTYANASYTVITPANYLAFVT